MLPEDLYPEWAANSRWRDKLAKKAAHKALDLPNDDMQITQTRNGVSPAAVAGIAAAVGCPPLALAGVMAWQLMQKDDQPVMPPVDSAYEVLFYDKNGKPIEVPLRGQD